MNAFVPVALPPGVVTTTFTWPAAWMGAVQVRLKPFGATTTLVAAMPPKVTVVWPTAKFVPGIVTFGVVWLVTLMVQIRRWGLTGVNRRRLWCLSMFWHFLDVVWIGVFTFVYLMGVLP